MLSNASNICIPPPVKPLQVQIAHGKVLAAVFPEHEPGVVPPVVKMMGGPPFTHFAGGGPTTTAGTHVPPTHPDPAAHALPHEPQLARSLEKSTQRLLQTERFPGQLAVHPLETHTWFAAQTVLHPPQWAGSPAVGMHWPLQ